VNPLWILLPFVLLVNVPFGWWREGLRKFSPLWIVAVHGPVPLIAGLRIALDQPWRLSTFPAFVAAYFLGQFIGVRLRRRFHPPVGRGNAVVDPAAGPDAPIPLRTTGRE
jgi:hypothetical protein